jgi:hypothetical protein
MNATTIDATDYFGLDADFFDQFDRHPAGRDEPNVHLAGDEAAAILRRDTFAMRLFLAFGNTMFLFAVFAVAIFLALTVAAIITVHQGPWQPGGLGFLFDVANRLLRLG